MLERTRDPMVSALKAQSTHRPIPVRRFVYQQLGLSKPGFWADWRKRTVDEPEPSEFQEEKAPEKSQGPSLYVPYPPVKFQGDKPTPKKGSFKNMEFAQEVKPKTKRQPRWFPFDWASMLEGQSKPWFKANQLLKTDSMSRAMLRLAVEKQRSADFLRSKGEKGKGWDGLKNLNKFSAALNVERVGRNQALKQFGQVEPPNFIKTQEELKYRSKNSVYTPPKYQTSPPGARFVVSDYTAGQPVASQNGYDNPQKQAAKGLADRMLVERLGRPATGSLSRSGGTRARHVW